MSTERDLPTGIPFEKLGHGQERNLKENFVEPLQSPEKTDSEGARASLRKWTRAVASGRVDDVMSLYAPNAILVPTLSNEIIVEEKGRRRYFEFLLSNGVSECTVNSEEIRIDQEGCTVAIGGIYTFTFQKDSGEEAVPARFLFTFEKMNGRWLVTCHHSSRFA